MTSTIIIDDTVPYTQAIATASQTQFDTDWTADVAADVKVYARASGVEPDDASQLVSPQNYSVTFIGGGQFVRVTFSVGRTVGDIITITRDTADSRENLYTNTNFTPSMLNGDFGRLVLMLQERQLYNTQLTPRYNIDATIEPIVDTILPILPASHTWRKNSDDDAIEIYELPDGGIAPADKTYVTIEDDTDKLPNSFPLADIGSGMMVNNAGSSILTRTNTGTANQIEVTNGNGISGNPTYSIAENPIIPGTAGMGIPTGTTAQRVTPPNGIGLRYNTDLNKIEFYESGSWVQVEDSEDILALLARFAAHTAGDGASMVGLEDQGAVSNKTVQDLAEATFIAQTDNGTLANAQFLEDLTTGIMTVTTSTGVIASRVLTGTANQIDIANGNGSAAPTFSLSATLDLPGTLTIQNSTVIDEIIDDDSMATATDSNIPTAESIVAYIGGTGGGPFLQLAGGTMAGNIDMDGNEINGVPTPIAATDAVNKAYVDAIVENIHPAARALTTANLAGYTYDNGTAGVGATLTAGAFGAFTTDGQSPLQNDRILVINQTAPEENGVYVLSTVGDGATAAVLTRADDFDEPSDIQPGDLIYVLFGTLYGNTNWVQTEVVTTIGTDPIEFTLVREADRASLSNTLMFMGG